jgi:regulator of sirC expression with transglutaminase-like and TPR domain
MSKALLVEALAGDSPLIEEVAFAIASDAYPRLDLAHYREQLDAFAKPLAERLARAQTLRARIDAFNERLYGVLGFRGNDQSYYDPRNSYLNEVIDRRTGIPITLSVVAMALGRRAGLKVEGIGFPGHFLIRIGGARGAYADPFNRGKALPKEELLALANRFAPEDAHSKRTLTHLLRPVDCRQMAIRMLSNLQQIYETGGDHARALVVCDRLVDIGGAPHHRRDRGIHALALGAARAAQADLSAYLSQTPDAHDAAQVKEQLDRATRSSQATLH